MTEAALFKKQFLEDTRGKLIGNKYMDGVMERTITDVFLDKKGLYIYLDNYKTVLIKEASDG